MQQDVIIIGAGPAGLIAAWRAARRGLKVRVLEKANKIGVKILMSGGTRCNVTQDTDAAGIMRAFGRNGAFLRQALAQFGPMSVRDMLRQQGLDTKVEITGKVFPATDRAIDVRDALWKQALDAGVEFHVGTPVRSLLREADAWLVATDGGTFRTPHVIVTVGGRSYPGCGTTGDGYAWLTALGHTLVATRPALVPLVGGHAWTRELSGVTLEDVTVSVVPAEGKRKLLESRRGSLLLTHFGFSGPTAMDVSRAATAADRFRDVLLAIDLLPDAREADLQEWLRDGRQRLGRQSVAALLAERVPRRLADGMVTAVGLDLETRMSGLPATEGRRLVEWLKNWTLPIENTRGFDKAEVTAGGISLKEVDPRSMASRLHAGLYLAGEILDLDGWIGGYNFQSAFSTGYVAGESVAAEGAS